MTKTRTIAFSLAAIFLWGILGITGLSAAASEGYPAGIPYTGYGVRNNYVYSVEGLNDYNFYLEYTKADGSKETILAYCFNGNLAGPETGADYSLTYPDATNSQFYSLATWNWGLYSGYFKATATRIIYYGYPYNQSGKDYLAQVVTKYGVPADLAIDAFRWATQNALWYCTGESPNLELYKGVTSGKDAMLGLAYEIYTQAYADSGSEVPGLSMGLFTPSKSSLQNMLAVRKDYTEPVVPGTETEPTPIQVTLEASKTMDGAAPGEDRIFEFTLYDTDGNLLQTKENDAAGTITFDPLTFTKAGVYKYTISETAGRMNGQTLTEKRVLFDTGVYVVTVNVTLEDGVLIPETVFTKNDQNCDEIVFANTTPTPPSVTATIRAKKTLDGAAPGEGETFLFELLENGERVATAVNDAEGNITFVLRYYTAGTHTYVLREVNEGEDGIVYDTTSYTVTIQVTEKDLYDLEASQYYSVLGTDQGYYIGKTANAQEFQVYCIDLAAKEPQSPTNTNVTYTPIQDPDSDTLANYVLYNRYGSQLSENLRKLFYYLEAYGSDSGNVFGKSLSEVEKKNIIWAATGPYNPNYDDQLAQIYAMETPENYHLVLFAPNGYVKGSEGRTQPLLGGVGSHVTYPQAETLIFRNETTMEGYLLPETGSHGKEPLIFCGFVLMITAVLSWMIRDVFVPEEEKRMRNEERKCR